MKLKIIGLLMVVASSASGQEPGRGCEPAVSVAMALKSTADDKGDAAAVAAWQEVRDFEDFPVWQQAPLEALMRMSLEQLSADAIRATVSTDCELEFAAFARETADQLSRP